jgi:nitroimidazol reductase NimA-like FMN-containing flavoprotein (pyridoxamine 5'-phosphate oxidase superfamily)
MASDEPVRELTEEECWDRVAAAPYGRLAMSVFDDVDIVPVNVVLSDGDLYFRTAPGSKLAEIAANPRVAFEVDGYDDDTAFSVVVKGVAERIERHVDIDAAEELPLTPWIPTLKYRWVRIHPESVTGRAFRRGPEPERYV